MRKTDEGPCTTKAEKLCRKASKLELKRWFESSSLFIFCICLDCGCAKNTCIDCDPRPKPVNPKPVDGGDVKPVRIANGFVLKSLLSKMKVYSNSSTNS